MSVDSLLKLCNAWIQWKKRASVYDSAPTQNKESKLLSRLSAALIWGGRGTTSVSAFPGAFQFRWPVQRWGSATIVGWYAIFNRCFSAILGFNIPICPPISRGNVILLSSWSYIFATLFKVIVYHDLWFILECLYMCPFSYGKHKCPPWGWTPWVSVRTHS